MRTFKIKVNGRESVYNISDDEIKDFPPTLASLILRRNDYYRTVKGDTCYYNVSKGKGSEDLLFLLKNKINANKFEEVDRETVDSMLED